MPSVTMRLTRASAPAVFTAPVENSSVRSPGSSVPVSGRGDQHLIAVQRHPQANERNAMFLPKGGGRSSVPEAVGATV